MPDETDFYTTPAARSPARARGPKMVLRRPFYSTAILRAPTLLYLLYPTPVCTQVRFSQFLVRHHQKERSGIYGIYGCFHLD